MKTGTITPIRARPKARIQLLPAAALLFAAYASGCGVLIGNVKPVTEKSESYHVLKLPKADKDWTPIESDKAGEEEADPELNISDAAYQSQSTGAVIMMNSACRPRQASSKESLRQLTELLILGTTEIKGREERELVVDGVQALQTTLTGTLNGERVKMRTVVFRKGACVYDMMYVSRPDNFPGKIESFERFRASFRFR